jgi:hypothetical protein
MEAAFFSKISVPTNQSTRCRDPEDLFTYLFISLAGLTIFPRFPAPI